MTLGVQLMLYGLGGVFLSLILFYGVIKLFVGIVKKDPKK